MSEEARRTLRYVEPLSDARTPLADFFSILLDGGIGKTQGEETAEASLFRSEETGKAKPDPFCTAGAHNGAVNHDGIIVLGGMKLQHHLASHWNALVGTHAAPSERQVRECPLNNDTLAWVMDRANLCRILNGDPVVVAAGIVLELSQENGKSMRTELTAKGIDRQGAEEPIRHPIPWSELCLQRSAFRARAGAHSRLSPFS